MPVTTTIPQPKPLPEKAEWPLGTYKAGFVTFDDFAKENFVPGMPTVFTKKEVRKAMLIYTPDKEKDVSFVYGLLYALYFDISYNFRILDTLAFNM